MSELPTIEELQKLPLRAIAAYAARAARRVRPVLRGVIDDGLVEEILSIVERVVSAESFDRFDASSALYAASPILRQSVSIQTSNSQTLAVMSLVAAAQTAYAVLQYLHCVSEPDRASHYAVYAASAAESAAGDYVALDEPAATLAAKAARADYETFLKTQGQHDTVTLGRPIDLSALVP